MQDFLEFHHLPSLFKASWQAAVLILLVLGAQLILGRRLNPRWRYALWVLVLIRLSLPWTLPSPLSLFNYLQPGGGGTPALAGSPSAPDAGTAPARLGASVSGLPPRSTRDAPRYTPAAGLSASDSVLPPRSPARRSLGAGGTLYASLPTPAAGLLWLWSAGASFLALCLVVSHYRTWKRVTRCRSLVNAPVLNLLEDCKQLMGVRTPVALVESGAVESPSLFGFVRPRLLLPAGLATSFSLDELRYVFLHELGHLKRRDIPTGWAMAALQILHWFNPLVWWGFHRMRADRELACDALALSYAREEENQPYGRTIIKLLEGFGCSAWAPSLAGTVENKNQIRERIEMIAKFKKTNRGLGAAATLFTALGLLTLTDAQKPGNAAAPAQAETPGAGNQWDLHQKLKTVEAGNQWAVYDLWDAYYRGHHGIQPDPAEAAKWLQALVRDVWVVRFEPVDDFAPANPAEFLGRIHQYSSSRSGRTNIGEASFFRTTRQGDKLVASFLSNYPDKLKASLAKVPGLKVTALERMTPEEFVKYEESPQESLAPKWDLQQKLKMAQAGNQWAVYDLWDAYYRGNHGIQPDPAEAAKWLQELVRDLWVVRFEPVGGFAPANAQEFLEAINRHASAYSGQTKIGEASFFRTTRQGDKLVASFLSNYPDRLKASLAKVPGLKVTALERITPDAFVKYEASQQESLAPKWDLQQKLKMAEAGNQWAVYDLWDAYYRGHHGIQPDAAEAAKWLQELVRDLWVVGFEPVGDFAPANPEEFLGRINDHSSSRSGQTKIGEASFFRTTNQGGKLVGSFLSDDPDQLKLNLAKVPGLKVTSLERITPEAFVKYEEFPQESLADKAKFRDKFEKKMAQDRAKYTPEQLRDAEQLYQVANQKWGSPEANESLQKMIKQYPDINRTGCAMLYLAQRSEGDERAKHLRDCIEKFNDCFYGDGVQVGAYARFLLAVDYKSKGEEKRAAELYNEIKAKYTDAIDHGGNLLVNSIKAD